jgi:hypothetical protein
MSSISSQTKGRNAQNEKLNALLDALSFVELIALNQWIIA